MIGDFKLPKSKIYLSRRNLLILLSKLDREAAGDSSACSIIKLKLPGAEYQQTMESVMVIAVEDEEYYKARQPGEMHPSDETSIEKITPLLGL